MSTFYLLNVHDQGLREGFLQPSLQLYFSKANILILTCAMVTIKKEMFETHLRLFQECDHRYQTALRSMFERS